MLDREQALILVRIAKGCLPSTVSLVEAEFQVHGTSQASAVSVLRALVTSELHADTQRALAACFPPRKRTPETAGWPGDNLADLATLAHDKWIAARTALDELHDCLRRAEVNLMAEPGHEAYKTEPRQ